MPGPGSIYTPPDIADFLARQAIISKDCRVLDLGVGEGAMVFAAANRLLELGRTTTQISNQIYGCEISEMAYRRFEKKAVEHSFAFPKTTCSDFFDYDFPTVDCVIGNPPYVRRSAISSIGQVRDKVFAKWPKYSALNIGGLSDLYVYFLLHAFPKLRSGGKLAVIVPDSWLNANYGFSLRNTLLEEFSIENIISIDRKIFQDALVKPVLLLATKKGKTPTSPKRSFFVRVRNGYRISELPDFQSISKNTKLHSDLFVNEVFPSALDAKSSWGRYDKNLEPFITFDSDGRFCSLGKLGRLQIGIQTLAKEFFILDENAIENSLIESRFLKPIAYSQKQFSTMWVHEESLVRPLYLLYCDTPKNELKGTNCLKYIQDGEKKVVSTRGKSDRIVGYQNKKRIIKANRPNWYDLKTKESQKTVPPILIPRLIYEQFQVFVNAENFLPGEGFIRFYPNKNEEISAATVALILSSTFSEYVVRITSTVYGGGAMNLSIRQLADLRMIDWKQIPHSLRSSLHSASKIQNRVIRRDTVDQVLAEYLGYDFEWLLNLKEAVSDLRRISTETKMNHSQSG